MARWCELEVEASRLAALARGYLDAHVHKTLATLRRDGSPRISGTEVVFAQGDLWLGSMPGAVKARDLQRDPRYALHSGSADPPNWTGDAKVAGSVDEVVDEERRAAVLGANAQGPGGPSHLFRLDVTELSVVRLNDARDRLIIESWHPGRGVTRLERR